MLAANAQTVATFLQEVSTAPRGFSVLRVFYALAPYVQRDTGLVDCSQRTLAKTANVNLGDVSRAMKRLVAMGVLLKEDRGRYRIHPAVMWRGELTRREQAEAAGCWGLGRHRRHGAISFPAGMVEVSLPASELRSRRRFWLLLQTHAVTTSPALP